ncbi:MAG: chemotaxis protein CheW [Planctomycetaceae bacterium]|jgi:two-component system chemotaxis sensor kinase CheA|nr:chemotaxis protein CheW [Planctomycetaceae bacterium]
MINALKAGHPKSIDRMTVRLEHLDKLLNLAGEVIITSSTLHELQREMVDAVTYHRSLNENSIQTIKAADEASRRISQELHDLVMAIRMVEIGDTFRLFRRTVHDLSRDLKKEIELHIEGENVLIDKALAERLTETLLHLIRNAADHGIEQPLERSKHGKPPEGHITLRAVEHENDIEILVADDGRGIDENKVIQKANDLGLLRSGETPDILHLLCCSGFSTRDTATTTSGRGVGLDIVNTMISEFNGTMELSGTPNAGTTFRLLIPKLRAVNIIDALIVRCSRCLFALSIDKVVSLQGYSPDQIQATMDRERFIKYLGEPVALFDLQELLGGGPTEQLKPEVVPIVIIEGKTEQIAVVVSEFLSPQKLVNVPLDTEMFGSRAAGIAGTCIISGGNVGLTVDVDRVVQIATQTEEDALPAYEEREDSFFSLMQSNHAPAETLIANTQVSHDNSVEMECKRKLQGRFMDTGEGTNTGSLNPDDVADLLDEIKRGLTELQDAVLTLEDDPENEDVMKDIFRRLHAAKGNFTMLGAESPAGLTHGLETLMDYVRKHRMPLERELIDLILDGISELTNISHSLPQENLMINPKVLERVNEEISQYYQQSVVTDAGKLMDVPFNLHPIVELQLLGALKNNAHTFETFLQFETTRQSSYLLVYLTLRKLCYYGTILDTIPSAQKIEKGECGNAVKILWATPRTEKELDAIFTELSPLYNISEYHSMPTNVFRYESGKEL